MVLNLSDTESMQDNIKCLKIMQTNFHSSANNNILAEQCSEHSEKMRSLKIPTHCTNVATATP